MKIAFGFAFSLIVLHGGIYATDAASECLGTEIILLAGEPDDFLLPTENVRPAVILSSFVQQSWPQAANRQFDRAGLDNALIHTFSGWTAPVCGATLEIGVLAQSDERADNDSIRLELLGGSDHQRAFVYWTPILNLIPDWRRGTRATVELDLEDLPPFSHFPTNIISYLNDGSLDLLIEDDTMIDFAQLRLCTCPAAESIDHDSFKDRLLLEHFSD